MHLHEVNISELSPLHHTVRLSDAGDYQVPEFIVISYAGTYRYGSGGEPDARYIVATAEGAHRAWHTQAIILDFSGLSYQWGDEMEWVLSVGGRVGKCHFPLVVVGDGCRQALASLLEDEYDSFFVDSLPAAYRAARQKKQEYDRCLTDRREAA